MNYIYDCPPCEEESLGNSGADLIHPPEKVSPAQFLWQDCLRRRLDEKKQTCRAYILSIIQYMLKAANEVAV